MDVTITHWSRQAAEGLTKRRPTIAISITDPGSPPARLAWCDDVLRLSFHDIDREYPGFPGFSFVLMTVEHANEIAEFVMRHLALLRAGADVVVHCEAGISRSRAVAAAFAAALRLDGERFFRAGPPNMHVYRLTLAALRRAGLDQAA